jgi:alpha-beta hydrolase superfamily lysophospholipase
VATGQSLGAAITDLLVERNPQRFDGAATMCSAHDPLGTFNAVLDMNFAVKTLLAPARRSTSSAPATHRPPSRRSWPRSSGR